MNGFFAGVYESISVKETPNGPSKFRIEEYREKETYSEAISFEKADGLFLFKANIKYYDMMMYFYAFEVEKETYTDEHGLCVCYPTEYVGTAEEEKLKSLLDEVAESFKLI